MIDPRHECWWSGKHQTELRLDESGFSGAGVSLRVLLHACAAADLVWYSIIYGDYDDNLLALGLTPASAATLERVAYNEPSPLRTAYGDIADIEENRLSDGVRAALGVNVHNKGFEVGRPELIHRQLYIHDDCFFWVTPIDDDMVQAIVSSVLRQHSFYLRTDVDWSAVLPGLVDILRSRGVLELRSLPDSGYVKVKQIQLSGCSSLLLTLFGRRPDPGAIVIDDGRAHFGTVTTPP